MDPSLAVAFAGTPDFALPALDAIAASRHRIVVVYTQPDRPAGRGRKLVASPVKQRALTLQLPLEQPRTLRDIDAVECLRHHRPDLMVVVAYGLLLPQAILDTPRLGCFNIHASLLPRWRGAAPVARAIEAGDATTGVCIMRMEAGLDTGPVMLRRELAIEPGETAGQLQSRLAIEGAALVVEALNALAAGRATVEAQDPLQASYANKLDKSEARISWQEPARVIERRVRAFNPWPVAETTLEGAQLRIFEAAVVAPESTGAVPGTILRAGAEGIVVMTGDEALAIRRLQLPGRRAVPAADFANARRLAGLVLA
ncbi:MAG: methionyl-tRNA formyltransferase [Steroidobacteraceae bacterium]